ncbi:MAG: hypothetical protein GY906_23180 [bacterium]|nr:hypothetical protein [bacterium]
MADKAWPRYTSHKIVEALKIDWVNVGANRVEIVPADPEHGPVVLNLDWQLRYKGAAEDRGYLVRYNDGYTSWSPSAAFEAGYTAITDA